MSIRGLGSALLALLVLGAGGCTDTSASNQGAGAAPATTDVAVGSLRTIALTVPEMACPLCANSVRSQLRSMGVREPRVDLRTKLVTGSFDPAQLTPDAIRSHIERSGFRVTDMQVQ